MTEKEIAEIRRLYKPEKTGISRVRGCYVSDRGEIVAQFDQSIGLMSEDEAENMLGILKKTLSGGVGRNLIDVSFSNEQVLSGEKHAVLSALRDTALASDDDVQKLYESAIESVTFDGSYLILLASDSYDVIAYTRDGRKSDESSTVFSYILCSICPVKLTKAALGYFSGENVFRNIAVNSVVAPPEMGFMFPAFDNRSANIYGALFYTRDVSKSRDEIARDILGCGIGRPAAEQKASFDSVLQESIAEECSYDVITGIRNRVSDMLEERKENKEEEPLMLSERTVTALLADCGVTEEKIEVFRENFTAEFGEHCRLTPQNVISTKKLELSTPDITVKADPERSDLIRTEIIDGVKYILIRADAGVTVNGVDINIS